MFSPFPHEYLGHWVNGAGMGGLFPSILNVIFLAVDPDPKVRIIKCIHTVERNGIFKKRTHLDNFLTNISTSFPASIAISNRNGNVQGDCREEIWRAY